MTRKHQEYIELVRSRKQCRVCANLHNPASPELSAFDSDEIGPWTRLHGDLDADILIVGQDWGDVRYFNANRGLDDLKNPTVKTLEELLRSIDIDASFSRYGQVSTKLFLTNAILCLKQGGLQAKVETNWFSNCGRLFLKRQIEIVQPRVVVSLGERAYRSICSSFDLPIQPFRVAVNDATGIQLSTGSTLIPVYHCGRRILNTHRPLQAQKSDWVRVKQALLQSAKTDA